MKYNVKGLNKLSKQLNKFAVKTGFANTNGLPEMFEAFRNDEKFDVNNYNESISKKEFGEILNLKHQWEMRFRIYIKDTLEDKLADSIIKLLDLAGKLGIDIEFHITQKMRFNETKEFIDSNKSSNN